MRTLDQKDRQEEQISLKDARCTKIQIILHFSRSFLQFFLFIPQPLAFKCTCFSASKTKLQMFIFVHIRWHSGTSLTFHSSVEKLLHHSLLMKKKCFKQRLILSPMYPSNVQTLWDLKRPEVLNFFLNGFLCHLYFQ